MILIANSKYNKHLIKHILSIYLRVKLKKEEEKLSKFTAKIRKENFGC